MTQPGTLTEGDLVVFNVGKMTIRPNFWETNKWDTRAVMVLVRVPRETDTQVAVVLMNGAPVQVPVKSLKKI